MANVMTVNHLLCPEHFTPTLGYILLPVFSPERHPPLFGCVYCLLSTFMENYIKIPLISQPSPLYYTSYF